MVTIPQRSTRPLRIFIADDSLVIRARLVTLLEDLVGVKLVGQAGNGAETISAIWQLKPDVVILDIRMPVGSGFEVLQIIKQDQARPIVIVLTNHPYSAYRQKCLEAGADFFLDKSTEFDQIPALLEQFKRGSEPDAAL
jgi:DNA-binding NarL/FixJ family response regulator